MLLGLKKYKKLNLLSECIRKEIRQSLEGKGINIGSIEVDVDDEKVKLQMCVLERGKAAV